MPDCRGVLQNKAYTAKAGHRNALPRGFLIYKTDTVLMKVYHNRGQPINTNRKGVVWFDARKNLLRAACP